MAKFQRTIALLMVGMLSIVMFGVLIPHVHAMPKSCIVSMVRQVPCDPAVPLSTLRFHLSAYKILTSANVAAAVAAAFVLVLAWLALVAVSRWPRDARAVASRWLMRGSPPGSAGRTHRPWKIHRQMHRWLALRERSDAASIAIFSPVL